MRFHGKVRIIFRFVGGVSRMSYDFVDVDSDEDGLAFSRNGAKLFSLSGPHIEISNNSIAFWSKDALVTVEASGAERHG